MKPHVKFGLIIAVVVATLAWLAVGGVSESKAYFKTVTEVQAMGNSAQGKRLMVGGEAVNGSIQRNGKEVSFMLRHMETPEYGSNKPAAKAVAVDSANLPLMKVTYTGTEPLPDTFRDGAQALA